MRAEPLLSTEGILIKLDNLHALEAGQLHCFSGWPNEAVPSVAAGVYTIWDAEALIYVGMSGRSLTEDSIVAHREDRARVTGLRSRLASHASGRRSGDQFCIYVADYLVLPDLDRATIRRIADRQLSFDTLVRDYVRDRLAYRFVETIDGAAARELEARVRRGELQAGPPVLNPAR